MRTEALGKGRFQAAPADGFLKIAHRVKVSDKFDRTLFTEFDPNLHNAVMHVEDDSVGEYIVVEDFQKGYMYRDTVLRFSMVKVAN